MTSVLGTTAAAAITTGIATLAPRAGTVLALGYLVFIDRTFAWWELSVSKLSITYHSLRLSGVFGEVESVTCLGTTDIPERYDERGRKYKATADDSAYATFRLKGGVIAHINMSWVTRVYRDDLVTFQVDGTLGSAVAGLSDCVIQPRQATPRPVWNPDEKRLHDFYADWQKLPDNAVYDNGFKEQWEMFIRHVCEDAPYKYTLLEGAKGVQLAECALQSWKERRWIDVAPIRA